VFRDDLTKLANRFPFFMDRLDQARLRSRRTGAGIAVMFHRPRRLQSGERRARPCRRRHPLVRGVGTASTSASGRATRSPVWAETSFAVLLDGRRWTSKRSCSSHNGCSKFLQLPVEIDELSVTVPREHRKSRSPSRGHAHSNLMRDADIALYRAQGTGEETASRSSIPRWVGRPTRGYGCGPQLESAVENDELARAVSSRSSRWARTRSSASRHLSGGSIPSSGRSPHRSSFRSPRKVHSSR